MDARPSETFTTNAGDDVLLSAKQIAPMLGYEPEQHRAVNAYLTRQGLEPHYLSERRKRYWRSDVVALMRRTAGVVSDRQPRRAIPESEPTRFRKKAS